LLSERGCLHCFDDEVVPEQWTLLSSAVRAGRTDTVKYLLERGCHTGIVSEEGLTAAHEAAEYNHRETLQLLFQEGADMNAATRNGVTPLHIAAENGHYDILEFLIESGVDVDTVDSSGQTALHYNARQVVDHADDTRFQHEGVAAAWLLFRHGATVDKSDDNGWTPLEIAVKTGRIGLARTLLIAQKEEDYGSIGYYDDWLWEELDRMERDVVEGELV